jgi:hypothetical protein
MWNRQREAEMAREILAEVGEEPSVPGRDAPDEPQVEKDELVAAVDAAE